MERRNFLTKAAVGTAAVALAACSNEDKSAGASSAPVVQGASPQVQWRLASSLSKNLDMYENALILANSVRNATGGKFDIKVFPPGELVPAMDVLDATQQGTVQCCQTFSLFFLNKNKTFLLGSGVPFGMNLRAYNAWIYHGGGQALLNEFYNDYNIISFLAGNTTSQMGGWFRKEIKGLADLKGLKMRVSGFSVDILAQMGVTAMQTPAADIYPALERGDIDAAKWQTPTEDEKLGLYKIAKNYYYPGWWEPSSAASFFVNKTEWAKLPKEYQEAFHDAAVLANTLSVANLDNKNPGALQRMVENGVSIKPYADDIMDSAYAISRQLLADEANKNPSFKKIYTEYEKYRLQANSWFMISETRMDNYTQFRK